MLLLTLGILALWAASLLITGTTCIVLTRIPDNWPAWQGVSALALWHLVMAVAIGGCVGWLLAAAG